MKLVLLLIYVVAIKESNGQELDLNFQQNDYKLKFERVELVRYNNNTLDEISFKTFKYNRTIAVVNATCTSKIAMGNDITAVIQVYKFMSNEYRFFPIHFGVNACKLINVNVGGLKSGFDRCGNFHGCPLLKGKKYYFCNWYPDPSKFPPFIPNGEYKMEMQLLHSSVELFVVNMYATVFRPIV